MIAHGVIGIRFQSPDLFELRLAREGLAFTPGDCVALFNPQGISRPYSIASGIHDDHLAILVRRLDGGEITNWLASLRPGDRVEVSPPFGWFRPGPGVFIATGVGIAPFRSYLRSFPSGEGRVPPRPRCLYGLRHLADAVELDFLRAHTDLRVAVSREPVAGAHHGRVTDLLESLVVAPETQYYLCGLDTMIHEVTDWLRTRSVPLTRIHREIFFHAQ